MFFRTKIRISEGQEKFIHYLPKYAPYTIYYSTTNVQP